MPLPLSYNLRSVAARWVSALAAVAGIAGTVGVFVAMLSLARGFSLAMTSSGSPGNAMVREAGSITEISGFVPVESVRVIEDDPRVARTADGPLVSAEVVVSAALPLRASGTDAIVQVRGVSPKALLVRDTVKVAEGRLFRPGLYEVVSGTHAAANYANLALGDTVRIGAATWQVVGRLDAGGRAFDSEGGCDANVLNDVYERWRNSSQSVIARLTSPSAFDAFRDALTMDPRLTVRVDREIDYYTQQSRLVSTLILVLGSIVGIVMGVGAVLGALNTMYSAVSERSREVATLRALGFGEISIVISFLIESLLIAFTGGVVGDLAVIPLNQLTVGTVNWQTFSHLAFAFRVTPDLLLAGLAFALVMGIVGGVPPAVRAARSPIAATLRAL